MRLHSFPGLAATSLLSVLFGSLTACGPTTPTAATASVPVQASLGHIDTPFIHRSELIRPKAAPEFELTDQNGEGVSSARLEGKVALVGFVYTSCPDICRAITATYLDIQDSFASEVDSGELELVLITTDPENDTPEQAKKYTEGFGGKWSFLTGSAEDLGQVWADYNVSVEHMAGASKNEHTWMVVLIDQESQIRIRYMGQDVPKDILANDVSLLLEETR